MLTGSSNWSDFAYDCDEQMQQLDGSWWVNPYLRVFDRTWNQKSSRSPAYGGRAGARMLSSVPEQPTFGRGIYKYMDED